MKRIFYWVILSTLLTTCQKNSDNTDLALPPYLLLSGHRFEMPATGGSFSVKTYSPTDYSVMISSDCYAWISETDALPGTSESIRHFNVAANNDRGNRSGYIIFKNNALQDTVYVIQAMTPEEEEPKIPEDAVLSLSEHRFELPEEGGEFAVEVECSGEYIVEIPSIFRPWLNITEMNQETGICHFTIATNNNRQPRKGYAVFISEAFMDTIYVIQETTGLILNGYEHEVPSEGGTCLVEVNTDDCQIELPNEFRSWITELANPSSGIRQFNIEMNPDFRQRTGYIVLKNDEWTERVYIVQASRKFIWGEDFTEEIAPGIRLEMVYVQGGTFTMGIRMHNAQAHSVSLSDYYIGRFSITQRIWEEIMQIPAVHHIRSNDEGWLTYEEHIDSNYPMILISWEDAQEFCKRLNELTGKKYALPTEAQWEFAAIGGNKSKGYEYIGSNDEAESTKIANELGIYGMGISEEWCLDWYGADYYRNSPLKDPLGPAKGTMRVMRSELIFRRYHFPEWRSSSTGFRVVLLPME